MRRWVLEAQSRLSVRDRPRQRPQDDTGILEGTTRNTAKYGRETTGKRKIPTTYHSKHDHYEVYPNIAVALSLRAPVDVRVGMRVLQTSIFRAVIPSEIKSVEAPAPQVEDRPSIPVVDSLGGVHC